MARTAIKEFSLANPIYAGAVVDFYTVSGGVATSTHATLYTAPTGTGQHPNPMTLGSRGMSDGPIYIDAPVVASVSSLSVPDHDTGVIEGPLSMRVDQATGKLQYTLDNGSSWNDTGDYIFVNRGDWATSTVYYRNDIVNYSGSSYVCVTSHTSGTFAIDLAAGRIEIFAEKGDSGAGTGDMLNSDNLAFLADAEIARTNLGVALDVDVMSFVSPGSSGNVLTSDGVNWVSQSPQTGTDQVARDQIALTNIRLMLNSAITTGALVQGKQWELSTDEWGATSTNETFTSATPNYYGNPGGYTADQIPTMTSATAPSGTVTRGAEVDSARAAWKAFDKSASTYWQVTAAASWIAYDWGSAKTITQYTIQSRFDNAHYPTAWTFDGWDGAAWVTLDTKSGQSFASAGTVKSYPISNSTGYNKYRLNITATSSGTDLAIAEIAMMESSTPLDMTLIPDASVTVSSAPTYMDAYFLWRDDSGSAVLGTDLTVELSRDGGTTYTTATLTNLASYDGTYSIIKARASVSSQPSGTSMKCRIKTLNTKAQRVAAPALYAE